MHTHRLGPQAAADLSREVLLTDGLGSFALCSPAGVPTRSYSGLAVAQRPPGDRRVMFVTALETLRVSGQSCELHAFEVAPGTLEGEGLDVLSGVTLRDLLPEREQLALGMRVLRRSVMPRHSGALALLYDIEAPHLLAGEEASFRLGAVLTERDMHHVQAAAPALSVDRQASEVQVRGETQQLRLRLHAPDLEVAALDMQPAPQRLYYRLNAANGTPDTDRALRCEFWEIKLRPGLNRFALVIEGQGAVVHDPWAAHTDEAQRRAELVQQAWNTCGVRDGTVATLSVAADAFLVRRESSNGLSIIAGYPWFADWGRDSMIALRGLTLATGRLEDALSVLETFLAVQDAGLIPNNFHDDGAGKSYNSADAPLWLILSFEELVRQTENAGLARRALETVRGILRHFAGGTRYGIGMDNADGLVMAGVAGSQVTWMDAKIHDWVVTPRHGKPVELQGLWLSALGAETRLSRSLGEEAEFAGILRAARKSFADFWNAADGYFADYLPTERTAAPSRMATQIRPNALVALALPDTPAALIQLQSALSVAARELLTPLGLRTLSPRDPEYRGNYGGDQLLRDAAYHQGAIWPWLLGAYCELLLSQGQITEARAALSGLQGHLWEAGIGSVSEVFDAHLTPGGCSFQAWSVSEVLRAHMLVSLAERESALKASAAAPTAQPPLGSSPAVSGIGDAQITAPDLSVGELAPYGLGAGLLGLASLSGPLPGLRTASIPTPLPPAKRRKGVASTPQPNTPQPPAEPELLVVAPQLSDSELPPAPAGPPTRLDEPLSVEDPDVIEPLT